MLNAEPQMPRASAPLLVAKFPQLRRKSSTTVSETASVLSESLICQQMLINGAPFAFSAHPDRTSVNTTTHLSSFGTAAKQLTAAPHEEERGNTLRILATLQLPEYETNKSMKTHHRRGILPTVIGGILSLILLEIGTDKLL